MEILKKSSEDDIEVEKGQATGFFVVEPENLKFHHVLCKTKAKKEKKNYIHAKKQKVRQKAF